SWNVKWINGPTKRYEILSQFARNIYNIALLQETHLINSEAGQVFSSEYNSKSRGMAILIRKRVQWVASEVINDPEGRFIIIRGTLYNKKFIIIKIYAPNTTQAPFWGNISQQVSPNPEGGGDFNAVEDAGIDRSGHPLPWDSKSSKIIRDFMTSWNTNDAWRMYPKERKYTFYSLAHKSYSRINAIYVSHSILLNTLDTKIGNLTISDHATTDPSLSKTMLWKLNTSLLKETKFTEMIRQEIKEFFSTNNGSVNSKNVVWDAVKAFCRGRIIIYSSNKRKKEKKKTELESKLDKAEKAHMLDPKNGQLYVEMLQAHNQLQILIDQNTEFAFFRTKKKYYELGDKAGALLAHALKKQEAAYTVPAIKANNENLIKDPRELTKNFKNFIKVCTLHKRVHQKRNRAKIPCRSQDDQIKLEAPLGNKEVEQAIKKWALEENKLPEST
uniref:exodeoxyribonuclease III n=1 Tax=Latimeria chalumnae TaxID=7897 RepID=H3ABS6_LATCH